MNKKWLDNYGKAENANESSVSLPEGFEGIGYNTKGRNYSPAWGGQFQTGGSLPGSVGFTYARTGDIPSNGKYAKKTMASAQNGQEMKFYQEGLDWKPKSMQNGGEQVSYSDPRYAELYRNRQVGSWSPQNNAYNLPDLPEVTVTGKDERVQEAMSQGNQRFAQGVLGVLGSPQTGLMELATGKQQVPSEAWGFQQPGGWLDNPSSFGKNLSNFAMDSALDPMNAIGVGVADDILRASGRSIGKSVEFDPTQLLRLKPFDFNFDLSKFKRNPPQLRGYEDDQYISNISRNLLADNQLPPPPSELYIPNTEFRRLTAAEKREGVKDFLNYRNVNSSGIENTNDAGQRIDDWLNTNRIELPDIDFGERLGGILDRYNIQRGDGRDFEQLARSLPPDIKPQFLQDVVSTLPRKITDDELLQARIRYQDTQKATGSNKPVVKNKSGLTKEEVLQKSKDKDKVSKMTEEDFQNTVLKPSGELVDYKPGIEVDQMTYNPSTGRTILKDQTLMSEKEYADAFNERLDLLNDIIAKRNKSGVDYRVKELSPNGYLKFETPSGQKTINPSVGEEIDIPSGESVWSVRLNPGQWQGEVQDIANSDYYKSIPGLEMSNTTGTVFADRNPRKGTGAYESINEYLKQMDLGRVKPGFNSQTTFSKSAWENFIKTGRGVGYYANPNVVYGTMKTMLPVGFGASYLYNQNSEFKQGGVIKDNRGQWDHPGEITEIDSNYITMGPDPETGEPITDEVLGVSNTGDTKIMEPGKDYKFKGKKVTEYPLLQKGGRVGINDLDAQPLKKLNQLTNFTNNPDKNWLDKLG